MKTILLVTTAFVFLSQSALACLHFPNTYQSRLQEGLQEVFMFHDGKNAHMVVRTNLESKKFPTEVAWVLPFPSLPSKYEEMNGVFFTEVKSLFADADDAVKSLQSKGRAMGGAGNEGFKIHDTVVLDSYKIQPIEILNAGAGNEFNAWLKENKFNPMPLENQRYYLKKGAVFLAIRMNLNKPTTDNLASKPLHIVYPADKLSMPIKFTHDTREFDLDLYVFSKKKLDKDLSAMYLKQKGTVLYENKRNTPFLDSLIGKQKGYISKYEGYGLNKNGQLINKLATDPEFTIKDLN
ncbi:DUF2330 domain-containing protein [Pseudobdellovibrio sp. HCB154]|uniref:DUF2330 domain-containing protein n=1 Tax=Pseudobdellovibrio sp. HCB154 TaxID=3386277 RepID=UPI00391720B9